MQTEHIKILQAVRMALQREKGPVALHEPEFVGNEQDYVSECIASGWVSSVGKYVDRFEADLAEYSGVERAIAVVNGTAALHICLQLVGVRPGDEVLVPALTFIATANAISYSGATPHFVDSERSTLGVDSAKLDAHLNDIAVVTDNGICLNKNTGAVIRALMPMHVFGHPVDIDALSSLCEKWRIQLVEDAAESLGSTYKGKHTGGFGRLAGMSFNGNKVVTTGGGGAILTNDRALADRAKHLTTTARVPHKWSFIHDEIGYNYRMPNINAALGCAQLERLPEILRRKQILAERYIEAFSTVDTASIVKEPDYSKSNYWLMAVMLKKPDMALRDATLEALNAAGFMARPLWTLLHKLPMYAGCPRADLSTAVALEASVINLPSSAFLAD